MNAALEVFASRRMALIFVMGFASGLPLALTGTTLQAWLQSVGADLGVIAAFTYLTLPYALKFLWAPLFDLLPLSSFGRRRSWMLVSQAALAVALGAMSWCDPASGLLPIAICALAVALASASQDIVIDAYRREVISDHELGAAGSVANLGYRLGMLTSGAVALALADYLPWSTVYRLMALLVGVGAVAALLAPEPPLTAPGGEPRGLAALWEPFRELLQRAGAVEIVAFVLLYKLGDVLAGALSTPFLLQLGFSKSEVAAVLKGVGLGATIAGSVLGGALMVRVALINALFWFGLVQAAAILAYAVLAWQGRSLGLMVTAVAIENFGAGLGTAAFVALLMALSDRRFTGTQFALLTSLMALTRVGVGGMSGELVKALGWTPYFLCSALCAVPALLLVRLRGPRWIAAGALRQ